MKCFLLKGPSAADIHGKLVKASGKKVQSVNGINQYGDNVARLQVGALKASEEMITYREPRNTKVLLQSKSLFAKADLRVQELCRLEPA